MKLPIYLDYMATTPVDPRVLEAMLPYLDNTALFGNPSSSHEYGWRAADAVEAARAELAAVIKAHPEEIIWTSGATEANNLAIKGAAHFYQRKGKHIITSKTEHKAVLDSCAALEHQGFRVTYLTPQSNGLLNPQQIAEAIEPETILVSVMHVNNEIGVIQDIPAIGKMLQEKQILFHVDAAQSGGKLPINLQQWPVDLMSFSAHKIYGPKGIGALYVRRKPRVRLQAFIHGGAQELGLRAGTLAPHQIIGMARAFQIAEQEREQENTRIGELQQKLWRGIHDLGGVYLNGDAHQRLVMNLNVSFAGVEGEALLRGLKDLAVSNGSACNSATIEPSYVLRNLGVSEDLAHSAIRFSLGRFTTVTEIDYAIEHIRGVVKRLRSLAPNFALKSVENSHAL